MSSLVLAKRGLKLGGRGFNPCRTEGTECGKLTPMPSSFPLLSRLDGLTALQQLAGVGTDVVLVAKV